MRSHPDKADGMADEDDLLILDSWTENTMANLWLLWDEVEQSVSVDFEFAPWHEDTFIDHCQSNCIGYHG
jgi:hypothetical protein